MRSDRHHRVGALQFAGRQTVRAKRQSRMIDAGTQQAGELQRLGVDVHDVGAGVQHPDRPRRRDAIEVGPGDAPGREIDRVERPPRERRAAVAELCLGLGEPRQNVIDRRHARPVCAVGRHAVEIAAIDVAPEHAFHDVAMPLDEARHQDFVGEAAVDLVLAPTCQLAKIAGAEDAAVAYGDMSRIGSRGVHRDDLARFVNGEHRVVPSPIDRPCRKPGRAHHRTLPPSRTA